MLFQNKSTFVKGRQAESLVVDDLKRQGHTILFQNLRTLFSEIDIVALTDNKELWLIEVKRGNPSVWRSPTSKAQGRRLARAFQHIQSSTPLRVRFHLAHCEQNGHIHWIFDALNDLISIR